MRDALLEPTLDFEKVNIGKLSGLEKAVILFRMLSNDEIKTILPFLDRKEVAKISDHMREFQSFGNDDLIRTLSEFLSESTSVISLESPEEKAKFFLEQFNEIQIEGSPEGQMKSKLSNLFALEKTPPENIVDIFKNEHPQIFAIALSQISPAVAKEVLQLLEIEKRNDILKRISLLKKVDSAALKNLDDVLKNKIGGSQDSASYNGPLITANILSLFPDEESQVFMKDMQDNFKPVHEKINKFYITFSDILALENSVLQQILASMEPQTIAAAICKSPKEMMDKCFAVVTKRAVTLIEDELKTLDKVMPAVVQDAQQTIIKNARKLESERKIDLSKK